MVEGLFYCFGTHLSEEGGQHVLATSGLWIVFAAALLLMMALDLGVFHRRAHEVSLREATLWSSVWITLAMLFACGVFLFRSTKDGMLFLTGYLIELSLSVDNVFLFAVIFTYFQVPALYQHRVLFWGIIGAIAMRGVMILAGSALINRFHFIIYLFGALLITTGVKMYLHRHQTVDVAESTLLRWLRRILPLTHVYDGQKFFTRIEGKRMATPLFLVLALVEATDLMFAIDSIPAIFAVTRDPFIVFTSNVFAILGLRSMYFLLAHVMDRFRYLKVGLSVILIFVGLKMLGEPWVEVPVGASLAVVVVVLAVAVTASLVATRREEERAALAQAQEMQKTLE
jgi:tellurite resistance protein TerC